MLTGFDQVCVSPRGMVIYPDNNSRMRGFAWYQSGQPGQAGAHTDSGALCSGNQKHLRRYTITLHNQTTVVVAAARDLDKSARRNPTYDPTTWKENGWLNYEVLRYSAGAIRLRSDTTGEFRVIAKKLQELYLLPKDLVVSFENVHDDLSKGGTAAQTRANFFKALADVHASGLDFFAYCGHGLEQSLPSAQVRSSDLPALAEHIRRLVRPDGIVIFYACLTGAPDGLACKVSAMLPRMRVWGHTDSGQASRNADKVCYVNGAGTDIRTVLGAAAKSKWASHLQKSPDFYARFPFLTLDTIVAELTGGRAAA